MQEIYTTSIVVQAAPDHFNLVCEQLRVLAGTEFGHREASRGKIIVLLEAETPKHIERWIQQARDLKGVLSVTMVYQHAENLTAMNEVIS